MPRLTFLTAVLISAIVAVHSPTPSGLFAIREQARVRAHFDSAEREVRGHSVKGLSIAQRAARARALDRVHEYAQRGVFPQNRDFPGVLVPFFVDTRTGTRCGMAYLIEQSGDADFVARIAETNNNATILDLKNDRELLAWLDRNGLTLEEAARIQPKYSCEEWPDQYGCIHPTGASASSGYKTTTALSVGADVLTVALNLSDRLPRSATGVAAIASGVLGLIVARPNLDESGSRRTLGFVNAGAGAISAAFGVYRLARKPATVSAVSFAPWLSASGASGLSARISF